ncbi:MAG: flagellar protein FlgN [Rhodanobacter sp.]|nr:MAG: flagellar protein FlgN [Rhodanobacter sp.]TAM13986.1 MAG: flagellar protein FlgN [Rhodanobacter sp.]TAM37136.1 MAG: flagellar protein FlgN [Rhodanobacter sp.]
MNTALAQEFATALDAILGEMRGGLAQLGSVLAAERVALHDGDTEAIDQTGARKQALMQQLEALDAERQQFAREQPQVAASRNPAWRELVTALQQCQEQNLRNGNLASQRLRAVRQALAILTGGDDDGNGLYDSGGGLRGDIMRSRPLAAA